MKHISTRSAAVSLAALALVLGVSACGTDETPEASADTATESSSAPAPAPVEIVDPWVRATRGAEDPSMTAAFMTLDNTGAGDVTLAGASSSVARRVELHEMAQVDGTMVMQEVEGGIALPAGEGQLLQPGGYHVMLMGMKQELAPGDEVDLVLEFSDGSSRELTVPVKKFTEEEGHYHAPGTDDHGHESDDMDDMDGESSSS